MIWLALGLPISPLCAEGLVAEADDSRGVKLSEAMDSAAKGDQRDLGSRRSAGGNDDWDDDSNANVEAAFFTALPGLRYKRADYSWQIPIDVRQTVPFSGDIAGLTHFTVTPLSIEDESGFIGAYVGGAIVEFEPGSLPDRGTEEAWIFECGLTVRYYLSKSHTALSPYLNATVGFQFLNWEYRNPIVSGGERIKYDGLSGIEGYAGFGLSAKRDSWVSFFVEADVGANGFTVATREGFANDVFDAFGYFGIKAGLTLKF